MGLPRGLFKREVAAYELSEALGWGLVPLTVLRAEAPLGGARCSSSSTPTSSSTTSPCTRTSSTTTSSGAICAFDLLANNTDRKSGHCLLGRGTDVYAIDNGLSFHDEFKLRTVIWEFGGEPVPAALLDDVPRLADDSTARRWWRLLDPFERDALLTRAPALGPQGCFPRPTPAARLPLAPRLTRRTGPRTRSR